MGPSGNNLQKNPRRSIVSWFRGLSEGGKVGVLSGLGAALVGGVFSLVAAFVPLLWDADERVPPFGTPAPSHSPSSSAAGSRPTEDAEPTDDAEPPQASKRVCRKDGWVPVAPASVQLLPCIEHRSDGLVLSADVKAMTADGRPGGETTVWIWLMGRDSKYIEAKQFDLTRSESTLRRCRIAVTDQVSTCGPFTIRPPRHGQYSASVSARSEDAAHPPGWDSPHFAGSQGETVSWQG